MDISCLDNKIGAMTSEALWQAEGFHQEDGHLRAVDRVIRAISVCAAAAGNALGGQLLNPGGCPVSGRDV